MTKTYKVLMMLFLLLLWGSGLKALDQKDGVYQIGTAEDLLAFSELVNGGEYAANAVLTADVDLGDISYFPPIGKQYWPAGPTAVPAYFCRPPMPRAYATRATGNSPDAHSATSIIPLPRK